MASGHERVATGLAWTALLVFCTCFAVGLCRPHKKYGSRDYLRASQHLQMVQREAPCRLPQQRTICVPNIYPNESRRYVPHCTVMHRCAPDTGCCDKQDEHCQPKTIQVVKRAFLVVEVDTSREQHRRPEYRVFDNHTECECRSKYDPTR